MAGARYVTWVGIDGYYYVQASLLQYLRATIAQVGCLPASRCCCRRPQCRRRQAAKIPGLFAGMREYGALGLVWFDIVQHDGIYHQDWHVEDDPAARRRSATPLPR